jgi:hypothetical protein
MSLVVFVIFSVQNPENNITTSCMLYVIPIQFIFF